MNTPQWATPNSLTRSGAQRLRRRRVADTPLLAGKYDLQGVFLGSIPKSLISFQDVFPIEAARDQLGGFHFARKHNLQQLKSNLRQAMRNSGRGVALYGLGINRLIPFGD